MTWWTTCPMAWPCAPQIPTDGALFDLGWLAVSAFFWLLLFHWIGFGWER